MNDKYHYSGHMGELTGRLRREHETFRCMARIYCAHHHGLVGGRLCADCERLMQYAETRLEKCPYGSAKPTCANCPIHCYKPAQREEARAIMSFAGPRMTWRHPVRALNHLFDKLRKAPHPLRLREMRRQSQDKAASGSEAAGDPPTPVG